MLKKIMISILLIILIAAAVYGAKSARHEDYYFDGTYYLADGINSSDITINGNPANQDTLITTGGWDVSESFCKHVNESSTSSAVGNYSIGCGNVGDNLNFVSNSTFTGVFGAKVKVPCSSGITTGGLKFAHTGGHQYRLGIIGSVWSYYENFGALTSGACDLNTIDFVCDEWTDIYYNFTSNNSIMGYINNTECHNLTDTINGMNYLSLFVGSAGNVYFDDYFIQDGELDLLEELPSDITPPSIVTNLTNNSIYNTEIDFYISINESGTCSLNNTNWNINEVNNTYFEFTDNTVTEGNYNILISCNDTVLNNDFAIYNITKAVPSVNIDYPLNNNLVSDNPFNVTFNFKNHNPNVCSLYINLTDNFIEVDNISSFPYNETTFVNTTILKNTVMGSYNFEENGGSIVNDNSTYENDGFNIGASYVASKGNNNTGDYALEFDGISDFINISNANKNFTFGNTITDEPFSLGAWIYMDDATGFRIFSTQNNPTYVDYAVFVAGDDTLKVQLYDDTTFNLIGRATDIGYMTKYENKWFHLGVTYDGTGISGGIKIYINGTSEDTTSLSSGSYTAMHGEAIVFNICANNGLGSISVCDGKIDEAFIIREELSSENITNLMNYGSDYFSEITSEEITVTINNTLEQNTNYSLTYTFPSETISDYNYFINCHNGEDINSTINFMNYDNDFTSPNLNMIFPNASEEHLAYNMDLWLNFTTSEGTTCTINNTEFTDVINTGYEYAFFEPELNNSEYNFLINCTDLSIHNNSAVKLINITKDQEFPLLTMITPSNNSAIENIGSFDLIFNVSDNHELYSLVFNITNTENETKVYEESFNLSPSTTFQYDSAISSIGWDNATYLLHIKATDAHTGKKIKAAKSITKNSDELEFNMEHAKIKIKSKGGHEKKTNTKKLKDRYTFEFEYNQPTIEKVYEVSADKNIVYLPDSSFPAHFIIDDMYWMDFAGDGDVSVVKNQDNKSYTVTVDNSDSVTSFNSIGELNIIERDILFQLTEEETPYDISTLSPNNWFNYDKLNPSTTAGVLLYIFLFMILVGGIVFAEHTRIPMIMLLVGILWLFYSILIFASISAIFGSILGGLSVLYVIRAFNFSS